MWIEIRIAEWWIRCKEAFIVRSFDISGTRWLTTHVRIYDTAVAELAEEGHLHNGKFIRLVSEDHPGIGEV